MIILRGRRAPDPAYFRKGERRFWDAENVDKSMHPVSPAIYVFYTLILLHKNYF
jgi:hypothetical protein